MNVQSIVSDYFVTFNEISFSRPFLLSENRWVFHRSVQLLENPVVITHDHALIARFGVIAASLLTTTTQIQMLLT